MNETLKIIAKTREYLDYLENHVRNVHTAWHELQSKCKDMTFVYDDYRFHSIDVAVRHHDLSKLSAEEFVQYRESFYPADNEKGEPLGDAWEHHKANNTHHWENWTKQTFYNPYEWEVHCVHMVIDWMAMGYQFGDTAQEYYDRCHEKIELPDYAVDFINEIFKRIAGPLPENLQGGESEVRAGEQGVVIRNGTSDEERFFPFANGALPDADILNWLDGADGYIAAVNNDNYFPVAARQREWCPTRSTADATEATTAGNAGKDTDHNETEQGEQL